MQTQRDRVRALCSLLCGDALGVMTRKEARATLTASSDTETDDGSISVEEWHLLDEHVAAFEAVRETYRALVVWEKAHKDPS